MGRRSSIRLLSFFAVCFAFKGQATTIPDIVAKAKPAVVQVIAFDGNWSPIRTGTGFFVSADGDLLTNFHVIQGATHISARTNKGAIFVFEKLIAGSADSDVAFLKFEATDVDYLKIGSSTEAVEGETVLVIGNPEGLQGTVSNGIISAFRENRSYIQITAPISPGSSGSPVLDETGQVIGMATLVYKEGQNLNFAISAEVIEAVVRSRLAEGTPTASAAPSSTPDEKLASDYFAKALSEGNDKHYEDAINDYTKAIRLKDDYVDAYVNRGWAHNQLELFQDAIVDLSEAIRLKPDEANAYYNRGFAYIRLNQYQKAINDYTEAIRIGPAYADLSSFLTQETNAYRNRGWAYSQLGLYEKAVIDLSETIRLKPDYALAYLDRGFAYASQNHFAKAISDYTDAIRLKPDYALAYLDRGIAYGSQNQFTKAISDYTDAIRLKPDSADAYNNRGYAYYRVKQSHNAIADCSEALRINPGLSIAYGNRGIAYRAIGNVRAANTDFKKAEQLGQLKN